jgi:type VII secretion integral membrane protein EccD
MDGHAVSRDRLAFRISSGERDAVHKAVEAYPQKELPLHNGGSSPTCEEVRRVSVYADSGRVDLALPAAMPVGSLISPIVDILAAEHGHLSESVAARYRLSLPGNVALESSKTLAQNGIRDGTTLILTRSSTRLVAPRFDDEAEAVSMSLAATTRPWTRRATRLTGAMTASWLAGTSAVLLISTAFSANDTRRIGGAIVAAAIACLALLAATIAYRMFHDRIAGLTLGVAASGFAALAGWLAVPGGPAAPNALLAAMTATAATAVAVCVIDCCKAIFTAMSCFAAVVSVAAAVSVVTATPLQAIGAMSAAISLGLLETSARVSIMLAGLSPQLTLEPTADEPQLIPQSLSAKAIRADIWLTSLVAVFSASAAFGAIGTAAGACAAGGPRLLGIVFAAVIGSVLLLRARSHHGPARSVPLIVGGTATLSATCVVAATSYPLHTPLIAAAAAMLASAALGLGLITPAMTISPVGRRSAELLEYLALAAVVPLAGWVCGLYSAARGLNL